MKNSGFFLLILLVSRGILLAQANMGIKEFDLSTSTKNYERISKCEFEKIILSESVHILDVEGKENSTLPEIKGNSINLEKLYLNHFNEVNYIDLNHFPASIKELYLNGNSALKKISGLGSMVHLKTLNISGTGLSELPDSLPQSLETLILNDITQLDYEIELVKLNGLTQLKILSIEKSSLRTLPTSMNYLYVKELNLSNNQGLNFNQAFRILSNNKSLKVLNLSQCFYASLENNFIPEIPSNIGGLENLEALMISDNALRYLPIEIGKMKSLKTLEMNNSYQLKIFPKGLISETVEELSLSKSSSLDSIGTEISSWKSLKKLSISRAGFKTIPVPIYTLKNLEELNIVLCPKLRNFSNGIGKLKKLRKINLSYCNIQNIPSDLKYCSNLKELILKGNYITNPMKASIKQMKGDIGKF